MAWARIDDKFLDNPKVRKAGKEATYLYISALIYSSSELTEGFIGDECLGLVAFKGFVQKEKTHANKLVECGLWFRVDGGYQINDYLEYNPTKAEIEQARAKKAAAGRKGGIASAKQSGRKVEADATADAIASAEASAEALLQQSPSIIPSHPINTSTTTRARDEIAEIVAVYESEIGALTPIITDDILSVIDDYPLDWFAEAFREAARNNKRSWKYALAILKRWKADGFKVDGRQRNNVGYGKRASVGPDIPGYVSDTSHEEVVYDD